MLAFALNALNRGGRNKLRLVACVSWGLVASVITAEPIPPVKSLTPLERMTPARLKDARVDVERLKNLRRDLPIQEGLFDFRAILHAHAEDSAHTGGTRPEMLAEARKADVHVIFLTDHHRPPKDFITDSWRGLHDGVLFIPGSEDRGFLLYPTRSIMTHMKEETPAFIETVRSEGGLIFLSHIEERPDHSMKRLTGTEIYNRHADAKKDHAGLLSLVLKLTDSASVKELEESLKRYPEELFAAQVTYPDDYLTKWDEETANRRLTGVAANDCHHNQVLLVKMVDSETVIIGTNVDADDKMRRVSAKLRPGIRALTKGRKAGDVLVRLDFDPYHRSFRNVSTHILAPRLTEGAIREALRAGHAYVSHDWIGDPSGFRFTCTSPSKPGPSSQMGDEAKLESDAGFLVETTLPCRIRLIRGGRLEAEGAGPRREFPVKEPGVYRVECFVSVGGEERPWIYSNPIYIR